MKIINIINIPNYPNYSIHGKEWGLLKSTCIGFITR
jgi:hypothetical protein